MHYYCLALVPSDADDVETKVIELMAPYDENLEVENYREYLDENKYTEHELEQLVEFYNGGYEKLYPALILEDTKDSEPFWSYERDRNLKQRAKILEMLEKHGPPTLGDPESLKPYYDDYAGGELCFDEDGRAYSPSTRNPKGTWDFWQIGGRWTGVLDDYDPEKDIDNIEVCNICGGTGKRMDRLGIMHRLEDPEYGCNGCQGRGVRTKWPTQWKKYEGDAQPVERVIQQIEDFEPRSPTSKELEDHAREPWRNPLPPTRPPVIPHTLIEPTGELHSKSYVFLSESFDSNNKQHQEERHEQQERLDHEWDEKVTNLLRKHRDCLAVVVDYHS